MIIDLSQPHPYRDWSIIAHEKVLHTDGREYSKITYEQDGNRQEALSAVSLEQHLWNRINEAPSTRQLYEDAQNNLSKSVPLYTKAFKVIVLACCCIASAGILLFNEKFRRDFYEAYMGRVIHLKFYPQGNKENLPKKSFAWAKLTTGELGIQLGNNDILDIAHSTEDDILSLMVFEFTNFLQCDRLHTVGVSPDIANDDQYAEAVEHVEYDGAHIHHRVIQQAIKTNKWNPAMDHYGRALKNKWRTFKDFWRDMYDHPHAEAYRKDWRKRHPDALPT